MSSGGLAARRTPLPSYRDKGICFGLESGKAGDIVDDRSIMNRVDSISRLQFQFLPHSYGQTERFLSYRLPYSWI